MLKNSLLAGAALLFGASAANAADAYVAPVTDWTGFYVGVHGGYGGGNFDYPMNLNYDTIGTSEDFDYDFGAELTASGFFGGIQGGFNWQMDNIVLGIEGDISKSDIKGELELYSDTANASISAGSTVDWFGTARLRAGFLATPELLLYATGGLAWGSVTAGYDFNNDGVGPAGFSDDTSTDHFGWTIGGGFEYAVTENISLKTEYLYVDLGSENLFDEDWQIREGTLNLNIDQDISFHTIRAGLNFRF